MAFVNRQCPQGEGGLANAIAMPQSPIAAGHDDPPHPGFDGGVHEIIQPQHIALKGGVKGNPLRGRLPPQRWMVYRPGLGGQVLNCVYTLDSPPAVVKHRKVAADPGERGKLGVWRLPRHQDDVVVLPQGADDKGPQLAARSRDQHFHDVLSSLRTGCTDEASWRMLMHTL